MIRGRRPSRVHASAHASAVDRPLRSNAPPAPAATATAPRGFTLIELLVVVAIIALLIAMILPALTRAREQAKQVICLANQKTLAAAVVQYAAENKDAIVGSYNNAASWVDWPLRPNGSYMTEAEARNVTNADGEVRGIERGLLFRYTITIDVYHCPSDKRNVFPRPENGSIAFRTYSMTNFLNGDPGFEAQIGGRKTATRLSQVPRAADSVAFVEESDPRGFNINSWVMWLGQERWIDPLTVWHFNKGTIGFADGHAVVHTWVDPRTIRMSEQQQFDTLAVGNPDYQYLRARWWPQ